MDLVTAPCGALLSQLRLRACKNALAGSTLRRGSGCCMVVHAMDVLGAAAQVRQYRSCRGEKAQPARTANQISQFSRSFESTPQRQCEPVVITCRCARDKSALRPLPCPQHHRFSDHSIMSSCTAGRPRRVDWKLDFCGRGRAVSEPVLSLTSDLDRARYPGDSMSGVNGWCRGFGEGLLEGRMVYTDELMVPRPTTER